MFCEIRLLVRGQKFSCQNRLTSLTRLEAFEMLAWRRMRKAKWTDKKTNEEKEVTVEKVVKVKDEEEIEKLKKEIEELKKKINKDIYDDEKKGGWFGSNLLNRK